MGVTMSFRGLREIGQGRWEYRRRVPASAKAALGKSEWKRVITAKSDKELLRQYALVEAAFDQEVATAKAPPAASAAALTPRAAWNEMLKQAEEMSAGVIGVDDPSEAREIVAESVASLGRSDPLLVQALMDPHRLPPALTLQDAVNVYVKEHLGGGEGAEHRGTMVRLKRVLRYAAEVGLPTSTPLADLNREQARQVRDYMLSRDRTGGEGAKVAPSSVKRDLGLLRTTISYGARELGVRDFDNPFDRLPIEGLSASTGARVSARDKVAPLPDVIASAMESKLTGDLHLIWRLLTGTGCRLGEITGLRVEDVVIEGATPHIRIEWHEARRLKSLSSIRSVPLTGDPASGPPRCHRRAT